MNKNYKSIINNLTSITNEAIYADTQNNEYHTLFMGVILRALLDVTKPTIPNEPTHIKIDRMAARAWFFNCSGVTCENFEYVCDIAGINPVAMRNITYKILQREDVDDVRTQINSFFNQSSIYYEG